MAGGGAPHARSSSRQAVAAGVAQCPSVQQNHAAAHSRAAGKWAQWVRADPVPIRVEVHLPQP